MRIKSVTDVITNSSTEVFAIITRDTVKDLKEMINLLLEAGGSKVSCDDLFDIHLEASVYAKDEYEGEWEDLTDEEKLDYCFKKTEESWDYNYLYPTVKILPKNKNIPDRLLVLLGRAVDLGMSPVDSYYNG